jgi:hypothetical protein
VTASYSIPSCGALVAHTSPLALPPTRFLRFFWATGSQAPMLLHYLLNTIDSACRPEAQSKPRPAIRLVDRKPEGNV